MWTDENDWSTLRVDAYCFWTKEGKNVRFQKYPDTHGRGLLLQALEHINNDEPYVIPFLTFTR